VGGARGKTTEEEDVAENAREEDEGEGDLVIDWVGEADAVPDKWKREAGGSQCQRDPSVWLLERTATRMILCRENDTSPRAVFIRAMYPSPSQLRGTVLFPTTGWLYTHAMRSGLQRPNRIGQH
jgi:hypothetical protein